MAKQLVEESEVFSASEETWTRVLLRLSRVVADNLTEDNESEVKLFSPAATQGFQLEPSLSFSRSDSIYLDSSRSNDFSPTQQIESAGSTAAVFGSERWGGEISSLKELANVVCIEGSVPEQSMFVDGYMMKKNLAHKHMRRRIISPRILLISCPIEYYKYKYQYASLETLLTQEQEYVSPPA